MAVPIILLLKAFFDAVSNYMTFYQQDNFALAIAGLYIDFIFTKGQHSMYVIVLETVVDLRASSFSVVIIAIVQKVLVFVISKLITLIEPRYIDEDG